MKALFVGPFQGFGRFLQIKFYKILVRSDKDF